MGTVKKFLNIDLIPFSIIHIIAGGNSIKPYDLSIL